jgi:glycosyltransferase involved in cell wall biosynthesis/2-polyprenyl-3-methyl-5-hydroxy-6-metoxy-1,4-benzoquinol methylase
MPFDGDTIATKSLGGSETAAYYLAVELAKRGHRVSCFTNTDGESKKHGVNWCSAGRQTNETPMGERFEHYAAHTPMDVLIVQRHPAGFSKRWNAKVCLWQLHDLALYRNAAHMLNGMWQVDAVTTVSQWHADQVRKVWGLPEEILRVVPNGVDPALYSDTQRKPCITIRGDKTDVLQDPKTGAVMQVVLPAKKYLLLYQSRPERGLEHLVRPGGIMDRIRALPVHLVVCGYDNTVPAMAAYYEKLMAQAAELPNVSIIGALTKPQLAELQKKCDLLIYPTEFDEVSCITAMEAMHAGLPMLTSEVAALPETCGESGTHLVPLKDGKADEDAFVDWLEDRIPDSHGSEYPVRLHDMRADQLLAAKSRTWSRAADRLLKVIDEAFARKVSGPGAPGRILRTAIERSDIAFARWFVHERSTYADGATRAACEPSDRIEDAVRKELQRLYSFAESPEAYAAHYAKHQGEYYDSHELQVIGEDVTRTTRFRGVRQYVVEHCVKTQNVAPRVLDYGCAHGHYTMPLAKLFPHGEFVGIDISDRAVQAARKWAERDRVGNASFIRMFDGVLATQDKFDVILAGEVLEHVIDPWALLESFRQALKPGGCLIITTPYGRWEHSGTVAFRTGREHMFHFERADIEDICKGMSCEIAYAPAGHDHSGEAMGSWVWAVWPDKEFSRPDYERKLRLYAPRETISACLIVKDAEKTLRKCVESFVDAVDEVIICVDPQTSDRTLDVCRQLAGDFPNRPFLYAISEKSATRDGFDAARNESIEKASGDWILWCDADEEIHHAFQLHKLARHSMHGGYGFAQTHYSVSPDQVLTTDYPCRFFRNHKGVRFYGLVHEHPESEIGKAVPHSLVRPEVKFLHCGYIDEETRRKRYQRNLPLLIRDREKYPTRELNKFLWLRDLAQGLMFEQEQMGGGVAPEHIARAKEGIAIMEDLVATTQHIRMISDALPYYTHCVVTSGGNCFESEVTVRTANPQAPGLAVNLSLKGAFHSREFYNRLVNRFIQEPTKHYDDPYL